MCLSRNQSQFPKIALQALRTLSESGHLGSNILGILYAFHDEDDGVVSGMYVFVVLLQPISLT